jgi:hypothetical protein
VVLVGISSVRDKQQLGWMAWMAFRCITGSCICRYRIEILTSLELTCGVLVCESTEKGESVLN